MHEQPGRPAPPECRPERNGCPYERQVPGPLGRLGGQSESAVGEASREQVGEGQAPETKGEAKCDQQSGSGLALGGRSQLPRDIPAGHGLGQKF